MALYLWLAGKKMMEKANSSFGLARTKSEQLVEKVAATLMSPPSGDGMGLLGESGSGSTLSRKSSRKTNMTASPGHSSRNTHIRKARSAQMKLDYLEDLSSGSALSRASSASLGFSFSITGFTLPPDEAPNSKPFSDDETRKFCYMDLFVFKPL